MKAVQAGVIFNVGLTVLVLSLTGCGVPSDKALNTGEQRIKVLKTKGVPDSALSSALVYLYQARDAKAKENKALASHAADSMRILIGKAEADYEQAMSTLKPAMDEEIARLSNARRELTGIQRRRLDSALGVIDSFYRMNWIYQVQSNALKAAEMVKALRFNEARSAELWPRLPGLWVCVNKITSDVFKEVKGVERIELAFNKDSTCSRRQSKKGQTGKLLREDWEFCYSGKYEIGGDTIYMRINHFQSIKEHFEEGVTDSTGKVREWRKKDNPPVDSTITDNKYDMFVTFTDLTTDFKQEKKY